jgi:hypothetical protein
LRGWWLRPQIRRCVLDTAISVLRDGCQPSIVETIAMVFDRKQGKRAKCFPEAGPLLILRQQAFAGSVGDPHPSSRYTARAAHQQPFSSTEKRSPNLFSAALQPRFFFAFSFCLTN